MFPPKLTNSMFFRDKAKPEKTQFTNVSCPQDGMHWSELKAHANLCLSTFW